MSSLFVCRRVLMGLWTLFLVLGSLSVLPASAAAQRSGAGLGFAFGEPSGIAAKLWQSRTTALQGGMAWSLVHDGAFVFYVDHVWHEFSLLKVRRGALPLYVGFGARLEVDDDSRFGARGVIGLNYLFATAPVDLFVELVPLLDLAPETEWEFNGAFGLRYFFR